MLNIFSDKNRQSAGSRWNGCTNKGYQTINDAFYGETLNFKWDIKPITNWLQFKLGVNGYAFIVTNNGYVLIHPDLRPVFQDILKPAYNAVDMIEVELMDDDRDPRDFNENLIEV